jgi:sugar transferase EpsL
MRQRGKRIFDTLGAIGALVILSPLMLCTAVLVRVSLGSPILFRQTRPGLNGKPFTIYKFRTMTDVKDEKGNLLSNAERQTNLGRVLRSFSLDEVPELFNVLKGDMSLVGPRPLLMRYLPFYTEREMKRFLVLPGITGWAQINGRNNLGWDERLEFDVWYVENQTMLLDLKILLQTLGKVIRREDVQVVPDLMLLDLDEERRHNV